MINIPKMADDIIVDGMFQKEPLSHSRISRKGIRMGFNVMNQTQRIFSYNIGSIFNCIKGSIDEELDVTNA